MLNVSHAQTSLLMPAISVLGFQQTQTTALGLAILVTGDQEESARSVPRVHAVQGFTCVLVHRLQMRHASLATDHIVILASTGVHARHKWMRLANFARTNLCFRRTQRGVFRGMLTTARGLAIQGTGGQGWSASPVQRARSKIISAMACVRNAARDMKRKTLGALLTLRVCRVRQELSQALMMPRSVASFANSVL